MLLSIYFAVFSKQNPSIFQLLYSHLSFLFYREKNYKAEFLNAFLEKDKKIINMAFILFLIYMHFIPIEYALFYSSILLKFYFMLVCFLFKANWLFREIFWMLLIFCKTSSECLLNLVGKYGFVMCICIICMIVWILYYEF